MSSSDVCPHCGRAPTDPEGTPPGFPPPGLSDDDRGPGPPTASPTERLAPGDEPAWRIDDDEEVDLLRTPDPDTAGSPADRLAAHLADANPDEIPTLILGLADVPAPLRDAGRRWEAAAAEPPAAPPTPPRAGGLLLKGYAVAVTLACAWLAWTAGPQTAGPSDVAGRDATRDAGRRAGLSARVVPPPPLPRDRLTVLGQPLRVGDLEITPQSVTAEPVTLERAVDAGQIATRPGLPGTLVLRLELANTSAGAVFAPLDEAFVRRSGAGAGPTGGYIEGDGGARVYLYPLAEDDPWTPSGQRFPTLRPRERVATLLASDARALERLGGGPYLWRLRLRVGPDPGAIADVGIRLTREQVR
jgi:hypothetical protein